jgi:hypothetical protein
MAEEKEIDIEQRKYEERSWEDTFRRLEGE